jgi:hypothetical protein
MSGAGSCHRPRRRTIQYSRGVPTKTCTHRWQSLADVRFSPESNQIADILICPLCAEPDIRCRLSSQRSANAPTAAVLYCATGPGLARLLPRGIADMIVGPLGTTFGAARSVSVDCAFRTHAHVLVWSYGPSVRYCGMNCPTDRRVPSI